MAASFAIPLLLFPFLHDAAYGAPFGPALLPLVATFSQPVRRQALSWPDVLLELRHLPLLLLMFRIEELVVPVQVIKIVGLLLQLLVELPSSTVLPILLLSEFFF